LSASEQLRQVNHPEDVGRVATANKAVNLDQDDVQAQSGDAAKSREALEAEAEIARVERAYELFLREFDGDSPNVTVAARHLMFRCIAVRLSAQGRGELLQSDGELVMLPKVGPDEVKFTIGDRFYRVSKSEFPILSKLESRPISSRQEDSDSGQQAARPSISPEVRAELESEVAATLASLSAIAKPN